MDNNVALWAAIIGCYVSNALMWWRILNHQQHWEDRVDKKLDGMQNVLLDILERLSFIEGARSSKKE